MQIVVKTFINEEFFTPYEIRVKPNYSRVDKEIEEYNADTVYIGFTEEGFTRYLLFDISLWCAGEQIELKTKMEKLLLFNMLTQQEIETLKKVCKNIAEDYIREALKNKYKINTKHIQNML